MSKSTTNLIVILGIISIVFGGYFLFSQNTVDPLESQRSDQQLVQLVASSQLFLQRSQDLSQIELGLTIFDSPTLNSLKSFSPDTQEYPVGRSNPFLRAASSQSVATTNSTQ